MNVRKIFRILNDDEKKLIAKETKIIKKKCNGIAMREYHNQKEIGNIHNNVCPKCRADKNFIVDRLGDVHGEYSINTKLMLGFGDVNGIMSISTDEVNHCTKCENEWKKFKIQYVTESQIIVAALKYLMQLMEDSKNTEYDWKLDTISVFDDCHSETIKSLFREHKKYVDISFRLMWLEIDKYYKSIYSREVKQLKTFK